jgi:hypothetical protein
MPMWKKILIGVMLVAAAGAIAVAVYVYGMYDKVTVADKPSADYVRGLGDPKHPYRQECPCVHCYCERNGKVPVDK